MKIFTRTFLYTLALLVLVALLANGLIYTLMPRIYTERKREELTKKTDLFVQQLEAAGKDDIVALMSRSADSLQANLNISVGGDSYSLLIWNGGVITEARGPFTQEDVYAGNASDAAGSVETVTTVSAVEVKPTDGAGNGAYRVGSVVITSISSSSTIEIRRSFRMEGLPGTMTASVTLAPVDEAVNVIISLLPASILLCVVVAVAFSLLYARAITGPIKAISRETRRMTALERDARCRVRPGDEIGDLSANVNGLYENLLRTIESLENEVQKTGAAEQAKADFLRAASHELKTPVTAVSVILDNMILGVGKYKNREEWLPKCKELVDRLAEMLRDILDASRIGDSAEESVTESIADIAGGVLEPYAIIARAKGLELYADWSAAFTVTAPPKLLGKALSNVFSNAVQYARPKGKLSVYCRRRSLYVENECEQIPAKLLPRLFEPFFRPDEARGRGSGGNGLGLYITDTILKMLQLEYEFEPTASPDGMRFVIHF